MTTNEILTGLETRLPEHSIQLVTMTKNNGYEREGVIIKTPDAKVSPVIYLDVLDTDSENTIDRIIEIYEANTSESVNHLADKLTDFTEVCSDITYILVNTDLNRKLLETVPHVDYLDMSLIPVIIFDIDGGKAMVKITKQLMKSWDITEPTLFAMADENLYSDQYEIIDLAKLLANYGLVETAGMPVIYAISNKSRYYGAAMIIRSDVIDEMCDLLGGNFTLIPSSVHEWLCFKEDISDMNMVDVIKEVNAGYLKPEEILSDHPYRYAKNSKTIMKA